jgi:hypothetical protein
MRTLAACSVLWVSAMLVSTTLCVAQSPGNAGTVQGTVMDPSGAAIPRAVVRLDNPVGGFKQTLIAGDDGTYAFHNVPPNSYHLSVTAPGFKTFSQEVVVRNQVAVDVNPKLVLSGSTTTVTVEAAAEALENDPSAHVDVDRSQIMKLPSFDPGGGLSDAITYSTGGVAAKSNGMFHPLGDHAQTSFVIDGQPISDQQSKVFSTQLPTSAIQGMELTTGTPNAEFGDKTSLVAQVTTRSGLGAGKVFGSVDSTYGNFGTSCPGCRATEGGGFSLGWGTAKFGDFFAADGTNSGRFLDSPEYLPIHDQGNNETLFNRMDFSPTGKDAFHLNLFAARNWIQIPNTYDQPNQDQRQRVLTWNISPSYQHTFNSHTLLSITPYVRKDQFNYYPSDTLTNDTPATQSQQRQLLNWGARADLSATEGGHNLKFGIDLKQTRLLENFQFGITDPAFNSPCIDNQGVGIGNPSLTNPSQCAGAGFLPNVPSSNVMAANPFSPALLPFDLSRGGHLFAFHDTGNINQYAFYGQDSITAGRFQFDLGFRFDRYDGLTSKVEPEPRIGISYHVKQTGTVLRVAYARTMETPFNENLLLSSATGIGGLAQNVFGSNSVPISPGFRNQFNTGLQQTIGKFILVDADYFWKFTHNAFDFSTLLDTTITFPIAWHNSKLDGVTGRVSTTNLHGFQGSWAFGHTRARFFPPENGGLIPQGTALAGGVFRIDHDQAFQSTLNLRYQHKNAEWIALTSRYDSGLVISGVPDAGAALLLTGNQQMTIGLACNGVFATAANPLRTCLGPGGTRGLVTSQLINLPQGGYAGFPSQENDDHNPARVKPRNVLNLAIGTDNLLHSEKAVRYTASLEISNLTNVVALYNFLSTFSGTHFLTPRMVVAHVGLVF